MPGAGERDFSGRLTGGIRAFAAADAVIIAAMACGVLLTFNMIKSGRPELVTVFRQNSVVAEYPLSDDRTIAVNGKIGMVDVEIKGGAARILHADCPRQICRQSGGINGPHGQLICAPNNILIRIRSSTSKGGNAVDAVTY